MALVDIGNLSSFFDDRKIQLLEEFININDSLMPHSIAVATGCKYDEALSFLLFLYGKELADGFLLIYHQLHQDVLVDRLPISEGLPQNGSIECPICEDNIDIESELLFDLEFILTDDVKFIVKNGQK